MKIITFKWKSNNNYRSEFDAQSVNILYNMVKRNIAQYFDYEFICITDSTEGINPEIKTIPLWDNPQPVFGGVSKPNCFYRLRAFSEEMKEVIGDRFCWLDIDCVITGDITPILELKNDFIINRPSNIRNYYNGSMVMMNAGARKDVWEKFDPETSPQETKDLGFIGSDQAWIANCLGKKEAVFTNKDGVYAYESDIMGDHEGELPENAAIVFFQGRFNPWDKHIQHAHSWVKDHYK